MIPNTYAEIISPIPTVSIRKGIPSSAPYPYASTNGIIVAFASTVGNGERYFTLRKRYAPYAPISVASVPNTMSCQIAEARRFEIRHPIARPGIAAVVNTGSTQSISEILTWITPDDSPKAAQIIVRVT